eukprot:g30121.t1
MLPLRWSLRIHVLLPVVAICLQGVQLNSNLFPEAQIMSWPWFAMSVATCISSTLGLLVLHSLGNQMGHPVLEQIGKGQPLACTMLATASEESVVPLPLLAAAETVLLDLEALKSPNILQKLASASATQVVVPASSMRELQPMLQKQLEELSCINVIDIDLSECDFESHWSSVWDRLHWPLKVARRVRGKHDKKEVVAIIAKLANCKLLEELVFVDCYFEFSGISTDAWHLLGNAEWPELKIANFSFCFENDPAQPVLQMLARCRKLTSLKLLRCGVTVEHLRALPKGCWPCLSPEACAFDGDLGRFAAARAMAAPGPEGLDADADAVAVDVDVEDVDRSPARKSRRVRRVRRKRSTVTGERESSKESEMVPSSSAQVEGESESDLASTRPKGRKPKKKGVVKVRRVRRKDSQ